jgi:hypothetical protein
MFILLAEAVARRAKARGRPLPETQAKGLPMTDIDDDDDDDNANTTVAREVAEVAAAWLRDVMTKLSADAGVLILTQGANVVSTVNLPPGLAPSEVEQWAVGLSGELRLLADDIEHGDTRNGLERQAAEQRTHET